MANTHFTGLSVDLWSRLCGMVVFSLYCAPDQNAIAVALYTTKVSKQLWHFLWKTSSAYLVPIDIWLKQHGQNGKLKMVRSWLVASSRIYQHQWFASNFEVYLFPVIQVDISSVVSNWCFHFISNIQGKTHFEFFCFKFFFNYKLAHSVYSSFITPFSSISSRNLYQQSYWLLEGFFRGLY